MAAFNKFNRFAEAVMEKVHNLGSDVLRIALTNSAPSASQSYFDPTVDHPPPAASNGYPSTGAVVTITNSLQVGGIYRLFGNDVTFTASGGALGPFRYAIFYNDTSDYDELIGWWDYLAPITLADGELFVVDLNQALGIVSLQ